MATDKQHEMGARDALRWMFTLISPERPYVTIALIYGIGISILSLATPISVQMLINSVANTALVTPLVALSMALLVLLLIAVLLSALRVHVMEMFTRRFYARLVAEITTRAIHASNPFFQDAKREDLFNRYFDVVTVQKSVPSLLIGGFTIILQSAVGFAVTSFYHPFFLAFNGLVIFFAFLILLIWTRGAIRSGIALSHAKYEAARWLENVGISNGFYKSQRHVGYAMDRSEEVTANYMKQRKRHFFYSYAQTVSFLLLYALSSAGLLALGGWLVIEEQLSIGQLVAAELILSAAFFGLGQIGPYLDNTYDLVAASEEIGLIFHIDQEDPKATARDEAADGTLEFRETVFSSNRGGTTEFNISIPAGSNLRAMAEDHETQRFFTHALKRHEKPKRGVITVGGQDILNINSFKLRSDVIVLDRPSMVDSTIREYLQLSNPQFSSADTLEMLDTVGLSNRVASLPLGMDTPLSTSGWPLSLAEAMALKLAGAIMRNPRILLLTPLFDMLEPDILLRVGAELATHGTTTIHFTARNINGTDTQYLWVGRDEQKIVRNAGALMQLYAATKSNSKLSAGAEQ
ncbi:MAG: ABC transporter ATP-binding protein [Pseudomonadota bacterium]